MIREYKGFYNKSEFYSLMGHFFGDRKYKKLMPYLVNDDDTIWQLIIDECNKVIGFISYKESKTRVHIGYCYSEDEINYKKLLQLLPNKNTVVELEKNFNKDVYEELGYKVYKESKNYYYLELIIDEKKILK